ncbi:hypothetical protein BURKHO8Y_20097 [Burkholderia sp. 8Y]|nr:hypothetical protein BURKHO8Y_20097 [Burkholderia sp. 8Y]
MNLRKNRDNSCDARPSVLLNFKMACYIPSAFVLRGDGRGLRALMLSTQRNSDIRGFWRP